MTVHDSDEDRREVISFDDALESIGSCGRFQVLLCCVVGHSMMIYAMQNIGYVYLAAVPQHRCRIPELDKGNFSEKFVLNYSIPSINGKLSSCAMYDKNYTAIATEGTEWYTGNVSNISIVPCTNGWKYDRSTFTNTIVMQFNLVCNRKYITSAIYTVAAMGALGFDMMSGPLLDRFGRRKMFIVSLSLTIAFGSLKVVSYNLIMLTVLRTLMLGCLTITQNASYLYVFECVAQNNRAHSTISLHYFFALGTLSLPLFAYLIRDWRYLQLSFTLPFLLVLVAVLFLVENPRWLYTKGKQSSGNKAMRFIAKLNRTKLDMNKKLVPTSTVQSPVITNKQTSHTAASHPGWMILKNSKLRCVTFILCLDWFSINCTIMGISLDSINLGGNVYTTYLVVGISDFISVTMGVLSVRFLSRRISNSVANILTGTLVLCGGVLPPEFVWSRIILLTAGRMICGVGLNATIVRSSELYPTAIRGLGFGIGKSLGTIGYSVSPFIKYLSSLFESAPFVFYSATVIISGLLSLKLEETKDRRVRDIIHEDD